MTRAPEVLQPREMCYRCFRARAVCLCNLLPNICNRTGVIVLQHPKEVRHPIGTARIARLGLQNVTVSAAPRRGGLLCDVEFPERAGLLFPHTKAAYLDELSPQEFPTCFVVLDGTWSQANALYQSDPRLSKLRHFVLKTEAPSRYRIRKQPAEGCLSTIEALVRALQIVEPETRGWQSLLDVFEAMVEQQIRFETNERQRFSPNRDDK